VENRNIKEEIRSLTLEAGFVRARFLAPLEPGPAALPEQYRPGAPALLTAALVYGNCFEEPLEGEKGEIPPARRAWIAPFARRNYYREAVKRLQGLSREFRARFGGEKADFRILCNSPVPEKPLALASGLGAAGRNGLVLCREAGSLFVIAAMTLPYGLGGDGPEEAGDFPLCSGCGGEMPPCAAACPAGALRGDGKLDRGRCIQWYASGHGGEVPAETARHWGRRLYGCTACQDACPWNRRPIRGVESAEGPLPAFFDAEKLLALDDGGLKALFRGSVLGLSWFGPDAVRRNAGLVLGKV
jgi:epoxyqueuosine reductase